MILCNQLWAKAQSLRLNMVQIKKHPRNNRADYFALKSNIDSSNMVSGASEPTLNTSERISRENISIN